MITVKCQAIVNVSEVAIPMGRIGADRKPKLYDCDQCLPRQISVVGSKSNEVHQE